MFNQFFFRITVYKCIKDSEISNPQQDYPLIKCRQAKYNTEKHKDLENIDKYYSLYEFVLNSQTVSDDIIQVVNAALSCIEEYLLSCNETEIQNDFLHYSRLIDDISNLLICTSDTQILLLLTSIIWELSACFDSYPAFMNPEFASRIIELCKESANPSVRIYSQHILSNLLVDKDFLNPDAISIFVPLCNSMDTPETLSHFIFSLSHFELPLNTIPDLISRTLFLIEDEFIPCVTNYLLSSIFLLLNQAVANTLILSQIIPLFQPKIIHHLISLIKFHQLTRIDSAILLLCIKNGIIDPSSLDILMLFFYLNNSDSEDVRSSLLQLFISLERHTPTVVFPDNLVSELISCISNSCYKERCTGAKLLSVLMRKKGDFSIISPDLLSFLLDSITTEDEDMLSSLLRTILDCTDTNEQLLETIVQYNEYADFKESLLNLTEREDKIGGMSRMLADRILAVETKL